MNSTDFTARKLASADQAARDLRLTHQDFRLLWLLLSAADRKTGVARRKQHELATALGATTRGVQISRDRLVSLGYLHPIGQNPGYVSCYNVLTPRKTNLYSPSEKGEPSFASNANAYSKDANGGDQKGERSFAHVPLISLDIPSAPGPRRVEDALGPLGAALRNRIEPATFEAWFIKGRAELVEQTADTVTVSVRSQFFAEQIRNRFESVLLSCAGVPRIEFLVRGA
jgi:hypothetical protein